MLRRDVEVRSDVETKATVLEEMRLIQVQLESDEGQKLRLRVARPLTCVPQRSAAPGSIQGRNLSISTMPSDKGESSSINTSHTSPPERALTRSDIKNSTTFSLRSVRDFSSSYHSAGLLEGCHHAFFNNDSEISVYRLGDLHSNPASPEFSRVFTQRYKNPERIRSIASSLAYIIVVTTKRTLIFKIDKETPIYTIPHGDWDPSGLACQESETHLLVFLGQCQIGQGQIKVYRYRIEGQAKKLPVFALNVPGSDKPKRVFFDTDSQLLTCITRDQNKLLVWKLDDEFFSSSEPFEFLKNKYPAVSARNSAAPLTVVNVRSIGDEGDGRDFCHSIPVAIVPTICPMHHGTVNRALAL